MSARRPSEPPPETKFQRRARRFSRGFGKVLVVLYLFSGGGLLIGGIVATDPGRIAIGALMLFVFVPLRMVMNDGVDYQSGPAFPDPIPVTPVEKAPPSNEERLRDVQAWIAEREATRRRDADPG